MNNAKPPVVLSVRHLKQYFTSGHGKSKMVVKAVDDISFDIVKGEVFGLVGESGCGKTTTGRTIIKLYEPTDGEVFFLGKRVSAGTQGLRDDIKKAKKETADKVREIKLDLMDQLKDKLPEEQVGLKRTASEKIDQLELELSDYLKLQNKEINERKKTVARDYLLMNKMQMIFQDPIASLNPRMTVKEIIAEGLRISGIKNDDIILQKVNEVLEIVGLVPEHASRYPHEFSGGQRQRIGIARSLIVNPELLIADEPISALDVSIRAQVINLLNDLRKSYGITILFIAHDLSVIRYFSDRIGVMYYGNLVELASSDELFKNPLHPYTRSLLSAVPLPDPRYEKNRKRIVYNPKVHNYEINRPSLQEITPGHFVLANEEEMARYRTELK